jgi:repressor LexA
MDRRQEILEYIKLHNAEHSYSPSVREIGAKTGLSSESTVHGHLKRLEKDGLIKRLGIRRIEVIGISDKVEIIKSHKGNPTVILWQGRRYVFDPLG